MTNAERNFERPPNPTGKAHPDALDEGPVELADGGDSACWAHLVCPECGAVASDGHRPECDSDVKRPGLKS